MPFLEEGLASLRLLDQLGPNIDLCLIAAQQKVCERRVAATRDEEQQRAASLLRRAAVNRSNAHCFRCLTLTLVLRNRDKCLLISKKFHAALSFVHLLKISVLH
jgi:hypothetical protein